MARDWNAEWDAIAEEHRRALVACREARSQDRMSDEISRRYGEAFTRRAAFIGERMSADPTWPDPDKLLVPI